MAVTWGARRFSWLKKGLRGRRSTAAGAHHRRPHPHRRYTHQRHCYHLGHGSTRDRDGYRHPDTHRPGHRHPPTIGHTYPNCNFHGHAHSHSDGGHDGYRNGHICIRYDDTYSDFGNARK